MVGCGVVVGAVASLAAVGTGLELVEPIVAEVGLDYAPVPRNSQRVECVLEAAGPMLAGAEAGVVLEPRDSNWFEAGFGALASKEVGLGLGAVMEAIHSLEAAAEETHDEMRPTAVGADPVAGSVAKIVVELDSVFAEPMVVVAVILAETVEPKEVVVGIFVGVAEPMEVEAESLFVAVVPKETWVAVALVVDADAKTDEIVEVVAALELEPREAGLVTEIVIVIVLELEPKVAELVAVFVVALELEPKVVELVAGTVVALELEPMALELEVGLEEAPKHSKVVKAELRAE